MTHNIIEVYMLSDLYLLDEHECDSAIYYLLLGAWQSVVKTNNI